MILGTLCSLTLLTPATKLLKLILRLIVLRIELHGGFEILDRACLVALGVLHLRHRLIRLRRLREVFEVRLQILHRVVRAFLVERRGGNADEGVVREVVLLAAVELRAELLELRETGVHTTRFLGFADRLTKWRRDWQAVMARCAEHASGRARSRLDGGR